MFKKKQLRRVTFRFARGGPTVPAAPDTLPFRNPDESLATEPVRTTRTVPLLLPLLVVPLLVLLLRSARGDTPPLLCPLKLPLWLSVTEPRDRVCRVVCWVLVGLVSDPPLTSLSASPVCCDSPLIAVVDVVMAVLLLRERLWLRPCWEAGVSGGVAARDEEADTAAAACCISPA
jgi:hypothetical protein